MAAGERVRAATAADAAAIAELMTELGYPTTPAEMEERLAAIFTDETCVTLVAEADGRVVSVAGAALGRYWEKNGVYSRLTVLVVSSAVRGRGIGRQLVEAIERWSAAQGARDVIVNSGLHRADAHRFYESCGFVKTGYRFVKQMQGCP
jgi:GNAT superfamily N-acetyltransferase